MIHTYTRTHTYTYIHIHTHGVSRVFFIVLEVYIDIHRRSTTAAASDELRLLLIKTVLKCGRSFNYGQCPVKVTDPNVLNVSANL